MCISWWLPLHYIRCSNSLFVIILLILLLDVENTKLLILHDEVIKWKHFPLYWPFEWIIHRWRVNFPHKGQCRGALMFSLICAWNNGWVNNREAGDLRRHHAHYDVTVMLTVHPEKYAYGWRFLLIFGTSRVCPYCSGLHLDGYNNLTSVGIDVITITKPSMPNYEYFARSRLFMYYTALKLLELVSTLSSMVEITNTMINGMN